jgi:hypothetical protein
MEPFSTSTFTWNLSPLQPSKPSKSSFEYLLLLAPLSFTPLLLPLSFTPHTFTTAIKLHTFAQLEALACVCDQCHSSPVSTSLPVGTVNSARALK